MTDSSKAHWDDKDWLKRQVKKQQDLEKANKFDPFAYFGALAMPRLGSEKPVHPQIAEIFMTEEEIAKSHREERKKKQQEHRCAIEKVRSDQNSYRHLLAKPGSWAIEQPELLA